MTNESTYLKHLERAQKSDRTQVREVPVPRPGTGPPSRGPNRPGRPGGADRMERFLLHLRAEGHGG